MSDRLAIVVPCYNEEETLKDSHSKLSAFLGDLIKAERISEKRYAKQGIDKMPTEHMGYAMSNLEKRGIKTDRGNYNRSVKQINEEFSQLTAENAELSKVVKESEA